MSDNLTPEQRRKNMKRIKSKDTNPELLLRRALWRAGIRYRKHVKYLPGSPDIVLTKPKIVIFVDGDFWHGKSFEDGKGILPKTNQKYWKKKLLRNIERDKEVNDQLTQLGWLVLRFWESAIIKDLPMCVDEILQYVPRKRYT